MRKTKQEADKTKALIMTKAVALFLDQGFSATTLDQIATAANLTRGAVHWHFNDKLGLVKAYSEIEIGKMFDLLEKLFNEEAPALDKIEHILQAIIANYFENISFRKFVELTWFKMEYTHLSFLRDSKVAPTDYFIKEFDKLIIIAQNQKVIRPEINSLDVAITITNMINGMYRLGYLMPNTMPSKKEAMRPFSVYLSLLTVTKTFNS